MSTSVPADFQKEEEYNPGSCGTEDDLFLIRVPKAFDVSKLDGKRFSKHHVTEVGRDNGPGDLSTVYGSTFYNNDAFGVQPLIRSQRNVILGENVKGLVSVTKSFEMRSPVVQQRSQISSPTLVPMPPGLKTRFTPFGAGNPMKSSAQNEVRTSLKRKLLDDSLSDSPIPSSNKKKKKKRIKESRDFQIKSEPDVDVKEEMNHTHDLTENVKSSKKKKKKSSSSEIRSNLLNAYSESGLSIHSTDDSHIDAIGRQNGEHGLTAFPGVSDLHTSSDSNVAGIKVKKDRKDKLLNSQVLDMDCSIPEQVNGSLSKKKKKKKDKRKDMTSP